MLRADKMCQRHVSFDILGERLHGHLALEQTCASMGEKTLPGVIARTESIMLRKSRLCLSLLLVLAGLTAITFLAGPLSDREATATISSAHNGAMIPADTAPPVPQHLTAQVVDGRIDLQWDASDGATIYNIYRGTSSKGEGSDPYKTGIISITFSNTLVEKGVIYYYQVSAVNDTGESARSNEVAASLDLPLPVTPTPQPAKPVAKSDSGNVGLIIFVIFVVVLVFGALGFVIMRRQQGAPPTPSSARPASYPSAFTDDDDLLFTAPRSAVRPDPLPPSQFAPRPWTDLDPAEQSGLLEFTDREGELSTAPNYPSISANAGAATGTERAYWPSRSTNVATAKTTTSNTSLLLLLMASALIILGIAAFVLFVFASNNSTPKKAIVPTATTAATLAPTVTVSATASATAIPTPVFAISAGGKGEGIFKSDTGASGGSTHSTTDSIDTSDVADPAPESVYQTERYGNFSYTVDHLSAGQFYRIRLHFAEISVKEIGQRRFNVVINGQQELTDFDIVAVAGGADRAIVEEFTVLADKDGKIKITFSKGSVNNAKVSAIEIYPS